MSQPQVDITELDGALGVLPPSAGRLLALVGASSTGTANTPATYARITDISADFGVGPLVEAAAHFIQRYGRPVVLVKTGDTTAGAYGTITDNVTGTCVVTADSTEPLDDYEVYVEIVTGGTVGIAGITYQYSLDGGRTMSPITALGTANTLTITGTGVGFDLAAGTLIAGDNWDVRTSAPQWNAAEMTTALQALASSAVSWEMAEIVGIVDGAAFDAIDLEFVGMAEDGKYHNWIGNARTPNVAESEATYLSALTTIFSAKSTKHGSVCAGACEVVSGVSGRKYRRPISFVVAAREASVSEEVNIADVNLGPLQGVSIRDENGNVKHHDESVNPGLDDARFTVLRTWDGIQGVYVNRPRIFSPAGSDFQLVPHRRVLNLAHGALKPYFVRRLNKPILVDSETGFILESEALEIESGARAAMRGALMAKPKASGIQFVLSRTDDILATSTLTGTARVIPLAYPEFIDLEVGFLNPALQTVAA